MAFPFSGCRRLTDGTTFPSVVACCQDPLHEIPQRAPIASLHWQSVQHTSQIEACKRKEAAKMSNLDTTARLRAQADRDYPQSWIWRRPGDELVGVVTAIRPSVHTAHGPRPVVELEELGTGTAWSLWLIHTVLRNEFARRRPVPGETVLVRYLGRVEPDGGGAPYEDYKVVVDRGAEGVDWHAIAPEVAPEPSTPVVDDGDDIPF
jgi:hypothetical protein